MGRAKQLLPYGGGTILSQVIENLLATSADPIVVVLGSRAEEVRRSLWPVFRRAQPTGPPRVRTVVNSHFAAGMVSSIQCGLRAIEAASTTAFAVVLGDQPGIAPEIIEHLFSVQRNNAGSIVIPRVGERRGHPVVFDACYREAALALREDETLRDLVARSASRIIEVAVESEETIRDIDTPVEYEQAVGRFGETIGP